MSVGLKPREHLRYDLKLAQITEGRERLKKEAGHSRVVGDRLSKKGNLYMRLAIGSHKTSGPPHSPTRILKVYREAFTGFSHLSSLGDLHTTSLSQGRTLGTASGSSEGNQNTHFQGQGKG